MLPEIRTIRYSDGYTAQYRYYAAAATETTVPRANLVFIHGIQSHGGWYEYSCRWLAERGYDVYFPDRRGSGLNTADRGNTPSFRRLLDDVAETVEAVGQKGRKLFLAGISWGGKTAAAFPFRHPDKVAGVALLCPGLYPIVRVNLLFRARIGLARLFRPNKFFPVPLSDPKLFTESPHWQNFLRTDPLATHQATARFLFESNSLDIYLRRAKHSLTMPLALFLAGQEKIVHNTKTQKWFERLPAKDKKQFFYPDASHTLEFEAQPHPYLTDLHQWLLMQIEKGN